MKVQTKLFLSKYFFINLFPSLASWGVLGGFLIDTIKVSIFWKGHKILRNLYLTFDWHYIEQK